MTGKTFYRYREVVSMGNSVQVVLDEWERVKETDTGHWIQNKADLNQVWRKEGGNSNFVSETKEKAWIDFKRRKRKQLRILRAKINIIQTALSLETPDDKKKLPNLY